MGRVPLHPSLAAFMILRRAIATGLAAAGLYVGALAPVGALAQDPTPSVASTSTATPSATAAATAAATVAATMTPEATATAEVTAAPTVAETSTPVATPEAVAQVPMDLLDRLGLSETLGMTRTQGLTAILHRIKSSVAAAA